MYAADDPRMIPLCEEKVAATAPVTAADATQRRPKKRTATPSAASNAASATTPKGRQKKSAPTTTDNLPSGPFGIRPGSVLIIPNEVRPVAATTAVASQGVFQLASFRSVPRPTTPVAIATSSAATTLPPQRKEAPRPATTENHPLTIRAGRVLIISDQSKSKEELR